MGLERAGSRVSFIRRRVQMSLCCPENTSPQRAAIPLLSVVSNVSTLDVLKGKTEHMPNELPYMMQMGNIPKIFLRIREAGTPPKFTHEFLKNNLGFAGSGDRGIIKVLKALGFLTNDSVPTDRYNRFKGPAGKVELAQGLREGWGPVFLSDQTAHDRNVTQLVQIFKAVTGAGEASAKKMAGTFKSLADLADWTNGPGRPSEIETSDAAAALMTGSNATFDGDPDRPGAGRTLEGLTLRHDIHLHLPATSDVAVYTAIFRAIRDELRD
jgi:Family of unknown function (DUF5343)